MGAPVCASLEALVDREQFDRESCDLRTWGGNPMLTAWQGVAGNLGMYAMGIPMGLLTDARGPRLITLVGSILLVLGYYLIYLGIQVRIHYTEKCPCSQFAAYQSGEGSVPIIFLCFFAFLTGTGGCSAFGGAIKTGISSAHAPPRLRVEANRRLCQLPQISPITAAQQPHFPWLPLG